MEKAYPFLKHLQPEVIHTCFHSQSNGKNWPHVPTEVQGELGNEVHGWAAMSQDQPCTKEGEHTFSISVRYTEGRGFFLVPQYCHRDSEVVLHKVTEDTTFTMCLERALFHKSPGLGSSLTVLE